MKADHDVAVAHRLVVHISGTTAALQCTLESDVGHVFGKAEFVREIVPFNFCNMVALATGS
jgi:hypothetical protein